MPQEFDVPSKTKSDAKPQAPEYNKSLSVVAGVAPCLQGKTQGGGVIYSCRHL